MENEIKRNIQEMETILSGANGTNVALLRIPVRLMTIDKRYQRDITEPTKELKYLLSQWDERKLLPIMVVPHKEEGLFYIIDGNGRRVASQIIDKEKYKYLLCMVVLSDFATEEERLQYEAREFAFQTQGNRKVTAVLKHGAHECLGTPAALILDKYKDIYHYQYKKKGGRGQSDVGVLGSYTEAFNVCKGDEGEETWDFIMNICNKSGFDLKTNGYSCAVLRSLRDMYRLYPEDREAIKTFLSKELRGTDPAHLKANAVHKYPLLDYKAASSLYVEDLICDSLKVNHKRQLQGKKLMLKLDGEEMKIETVHN